MAQKSVEIGTCRRDLIISQNDRNIIGYMFSCVIPVVGARPYFKETLASIEKQGVEIEVIVQDGYVEPDIGQSDALNRGLPKRKASGSFG